MVIGRAALALVFAGVLGCHNQAAATPEVIMVSSSDAGDAAPTVVASTPAETPAEPADGPMKGDPSAPAGPCGTPNAAVFNRGAAANAIGNVKVQACKSAGGPTGSGHLKISYAPDGTVSSATIDGGPFVNTTVGSCIARLYRTAKIPPFCGTNVTIGKSFTIN